MSTSLDDGLELRDVFVTAAVRCAPPQNKPTPAERNACAPYLRAEIAALEQVAVVLALGAFGFDATLRILVPAGDGSRPRFAHGTEVALRGGGTLLGAYHPSQRNVFTRRLTAAMFDEVLERAKSIASATPAKVTIAGAIGGDSSGRSPGRSG